eukprot:m.32554 g.32554  ORF g.32554 m.32554 type:complete len:117 (+) comp8426_c0_seq1:1586-1936(+)
MTTKSGNIVSFDHVSQAEFNQSSNVTSVIFFPCSISKRCTSTQKQATFHCVLPLDIVENTNAKEVYISGASKNTKEIIRCPAVTVRKNRSSLKILQITNYPRTCRNFCCFNIIFAL